MVIHVVGIRECPPFAAFYSKNAAETFVEILKAERSPRSFYIKEVALCDELHSARTSVTAGFAAYFAQYE
jgi:hypothetical protein